jgi:hypothetical protein
MALLENLLEGLSSAAGSAQGVGTIEQRKQRRQALSDAELEAQTQQILGDVQGLHERRSRLDPNSPTYQQDLQTIDQALHDARQVFTDLYHPQNNPGALEKFGGFLKSHLGKRKGQAPATPAAARQSIEQRMAGIESAAYAPQAGPDAFAQANALFKRSTGRDMTPEEREQWVYKQTGIPQAKAEAENWVPTNVTLADGREMTLQRNSKDGRWTYLDGSEVPKELLAGATVKSKAQEKPPTSTQLTIESYENAFDPPRKWADMSPEQKAFFPRWKAMQTAAESTGQYIMAVPQPNGGIQAVTVQRTGGKTFPGATPPGLRVPGAPSATAPRTPGEARSRITPPAGAGIIAKGGIIGGRLTAPQAAAQKEVDEAVKLDSIANQVAQKPDDAINQKRLAVALERTSAGRFTTQALDYIIKAGWGNTIEQWANNPTTGALPRDVLRQLVDGAHQNLVAAKRARDEAFGGATGGDGKKRVSIRQAMHLPQNRGKTKDQIKADIESHGYEAVP